MAYKETSVLNDCRMAAARLFNAVLLRNNRGMFLTLDGKRKVRAGLEADGSSDGIGWVPVLITPEMVGRTVAVFLAVEAKQGKGKASDVQNKFLSCVKKDGGIGVVAYSSDDVLTEVGRFING